ncbi:hypothetical protein MM300_08025 [Evansella sp. LMS18]|uniref:hypothetical protein n=1 Tax=Evansella sp. LMS18 TaxID=2924033 RepID=UPI0020D05ACF|nr:hypothetical protein [Evansella sp. LMS18]UTR12224.1 hypothetical protein MM300_08025 [Evansella sp. LMS18]
MKYTLLGFCLLLLFIPACNNIDTPDVGGFTTDTNKQKDWNRSLFGPGPANYGIVERMNEPFDPVNEANNTGTSYRSPATPRQDLGDDQDRMETLVYQYPGVTPGMVIIMGRRAWVNIMFDEPLTGQEEEDKIRELEQKLIDDNPRYEYRVIVNDFMR